MDERAQAALDALLSSKKYAEVCPDAVRRIFKEQLAKHRTLKEAEKAARAQLHQICGAFMTPEQLKSARECLARCASGDETALNDALRLHASTRERLGAEREIFSRAFRILGQPRRVADLACGLNPLALGGMGFSVRGVELHGGTVALVNEWAAACGWDVSAVCGDLAGTPALPEADITLMMKLLPVLERQKKGAGIDLLNRVPSAWALVTFPTRTLGGRGVGMAQNYARWFEAALPERFEIADQFTISDELCYALVEKNGD